MKNCNSCLYGQLFFLSENGSVKLPLFYFGMIELRWKPSAS